MNHLEIWLALPTLVTLDGRLLYTDHFGQLCLCQRPLLSQIRDVFGISHLLNFAGAKSVRNGQFGISH